MKIKTTVIGCDVDSAIFITGSVLMCNEESLNQRVRGSSPWRVTISIPDQTGQGTILIQHLEASNMRRPTLVDWAMAPKWLTMVDTVNMVGYDEATIDRLIELGAVESQTNGETLIGRDSLREFLEALDDAGSYALYQRG